MQQDVLETLHDDTGISGIAAHLISVHTNENRLVLLYIVPTATDGESRSINFKRNFICRPR